MSPRICRRLAVVGAGVGLALLSAITAADQIFMTVESTHQGLLKGSSPMKGWENRIVASKFALQASAPGGGKRQYSPVKVTKPVDASSPQLLQALVTGELLKKVTIDFLSNASGQASLARNVVLQGARVLSVDQYTEADAAGGVRSVEDVTFAFTRIEMNDIAGRTSLVDDLSGKP